MKSTVEQDIAGLQRRNTNVRQMTEPVRKELKKNPNPFNLKGIRSYSQGAMQFAQNLLRTKQPKPKV